MTAAIITLLALMPVTIIALTRHERSRLPGGPVHDDPLRVLDEQLAGGEIDLKDHQARRAVLRRLQQI